MKTSENIKAGNHDYCFSNWDYPGYLNENVNEVEVPNQINQAPTAKANEPDGTPYEVLNFCFGIVFASRVSLFDTCFENELMLAA